MLLLIGTLVISGRAFVGVTLNEFVAPAFITDEVSELFKLVADIFGFQALLA